MRIPRALALAALLGAAACAGKRAPVDAWSGADELPAQRLDGEPVALGGPGPVRLVELWATWCVPCGPASQRARAVLARHPRVVAYAVSIDSDRRAVAERAAEERPAGEVLLFAGGPAAAARRGFGRVPMFVAFDERGRVVGTVTGLTPNLGARLEQLLRRAEGREGG